MRHFDFLDAADRARLFFRAPENFGTGSDVELLAVGLGATLYSPATRPRIAADLMRRAAQGVTSFVVCLEDSIADTEVDDAQVNVIAQLRELGESGRDLPLIFVRVRTPCQIPLIVDQLGASQRVLTGFVVPKFSDSNGPAYLDAVAAASDRAGRTLLTMPVLESKDVVYAENRITNLLSIRDVLDKHRHHVLAVRIGATDMSAAYGLRRSRDTTVYNVGLIAQVIADIVNVFGREDGGYVLTGPVWEYFSGSERLFKPRLRESPFVENDERKLRAELIAQDMDALIREVTLDRANGLTGKSVIHPSHVAAVHALSVVSHEEFLDASDVLQTASGGGVRSSAYRNKMNESKPHTAWARRLQLRARVFGVANEDISFVDLLGASLHQ